MKYQITTPNDIELKYSPSSFTLVWEYIGPNRTHGDCYYNENEYLWYECSTELCDLIYSHGKVVAILCLSENKHMPNSFHLSVLEVFKEFRSQGIGSLILKDMDDIAKSLKYEIITLFPRTEELKKFYANFNYHETNINGCPIMQKFL